MAGESPFRFVPPEELGFVKPPMKAKKGKIPQYGTPAGGGAGRTYSGSESGSDSSDYDFDTEATSPENKGANLNGLSNVEIAMRLYSLSEEKAKKYINKVSNGVHQIDVVGMRKVAMTRPDLFPPDGGEAKPKARTKKTASGAGEREEQTSESMQEDITYISRQLNLDAEAAKQLIRSGAVNVDRLRSTGEEPVVEPAQLDDKETVAAGFDPETVLTVEEAQKEVDTREATRAGFDPDEVLNKAEAEREAEDLRAVARRGFTKTEESEDGTETESIDYENANRAMESGLVDRKYSSENFGEPLVKKVSKRLGMSEEDAFGFLVQSSKEADFDVSKLDKIPEILPAAEVKPAEETEPDPAEVIAQAVERANRVTTAEDRSLEDSDFIHDAEGKIVGTDLGKKLDLFISDKENDADLRSKAIAEREIWIAGEQHVLRGVYELRVVYAKLSAENLSEKEVAEIEDELFKATEKLAIARAALEENTYTNIAKLIGYSGESGGMPIDKGGDGIDPETRSKVENDPDNLMAFNSIREMLETGKLPETVVGTEIGPILEAYLKKVGVYDSILEVFSQASRKNLLAKTGETIQTLGFVRGEGNQDVERSQLVQDEKAFNEFIRSPKGIEAIRGLVGSITESKVVNGSFEKALTRAAGDVDVKELLNLAKARKQKKADILSSAQAVTVTTRGYAGIYALRKAGQEVWRQIKTGIAGALESDIEEVQEDGSLKVGTEQGVRVAYETKVTEIIEKSSNRLGATLQGGVVTLEAAATLNPAVNRVKNWLEHVALDVRGAGGKRVDNVDEEHFFKKNEHGEARQKHQESLAKLRESWQELGLVFMKLNARTESVQPRRERDEEQARIDRLDSDHDWTSEPVERPEEGEVVR